MTARSACPTAMMMIAALLMAGCAAKGQEFHVSVDGLRDAQAPEKRTYVLHPGLKDVDANDLQFKEFAIYVHRALQSNGFVAAQDGGSADIVIFLSYGIGAPKTTYYSYPIFGQVAGGGYAHPTGIVTTPPRVGVVGTGTGARTEFSRWAVVEAVDVDALVRTQQVVQLWRTTMTSSGSSGDLRRVFPIMVAAGLPYIATNTGQQVRRILDEASPEVFAVRGVKQP